MMVILFLLLYPEVDKAVGISDKGELSNVTSNFGLIANLHYFTPSFHWPNAAPYQHQYCPGFGILMARNGNVIESFLNLAAPEWAPLEGSYGTLHSGDVTTPAPDSTPVFGLDRTVKILIPEKRLKVSLPQTRTCSASSMIRMSLVYRSISRRIPMVESMRRILSSMIFTFILQEIRHSIVSTLVFVVISGVITICRIT